MRLTIETVDVIADTAAVATVDCACIDAAHDAARAAVPAGWILWSFDVSDDCDDECRALIVRA